MLNEFYQIHRGLVTSGSGIVKSLHPCISRTQKGRLLHVRLDGKGHVVGVEFRDGDGLLKISDGNKNSFPAVRVQEPLLQMSGEQVKQFQESKQAVWPRIKAAYQAYGLDADTTSDWPGAGYRSRVKERYDDLRCLVGKAAVALPAAAERFYAATEHSQELFRQCVEKLLAVEAGKEDAKLVAELLVGKVDKKTGSRKSTCVLYFDVDSFEGFERDAADPANFEDVTKAMSVVTDHDGEMMKCAISGVPGHRFVGIYPHPTLAFLGPVYIYSRNEDAETLLRYGHNGGSAFRLTADTVDILRSAAETICSPERENRNWARIPSDHPGTSDLLLAFIPSMPDVGVVEAVTAEDTSPAMFKEFSSRVVEALRGKVVDQNSAEVLFYVLRKIDKGNAKVIHSSTGSVQRLLDAANRWSAICDDMPTISAALQFVAKVSVSRLPALSPSQFVGISRAQFCRGGQDRHDDKTSGCTFAQMLTCFWGDDQSRAMAALCVLALLLRRRGVLVAGATHAAYLGNTDWRSKFSYQEVVETIAAFHILLSITGRSKESYMKDTAFRLGQLLSAADLLHKGYCFAIRGASVPSVLLGNSVLATAQASPTRALDILGRRWRVYHAWASKASMPKKGEQYEVRTGLFAAYEARGLADSLAGKLDLKLDEKYRAELLLGYIAGPFATEKERDSTTGKEDDHV